MHHHENLLVIVMKRVITFDKLQNQQHLVWTSNSTLAACSRRCIIVWQRVHYTARSTHRVLTFSPTPECLLASSSYHRDGAAIIWSSYHLHTNDEYEQNAVER